MRYAREIFDYDDYDDDHSLSMITMMRFRYLFYPLPNSMHFGWVIGLCVL
jgi:hypothetical protein